MSWPALTWAKDLKVGSSSDKAVLMALAYRHNEDLDAAYPSIASIAEFTELDRKTIIAALSRLSERGLIEDTLKRAGQTKQVIVYRLKMNSPKNGTLSNSTVFSGETVPKTGHGKTIGKTTPSGAKAPSVARAKPKLQFEAAFPNDVVIHAFRVTCVQWAAENMKWSAADAGREFDSFRDGAVAHDRAYADWMAAWRNWCRSEYCKTKAAGTDGYNPFRYAP